MYVSHNTQVSNLNILISTQGRLICDLTSGDRTLLVYLIVQLWIAAEHSLCVAVIIYIYPFMRREGIFGDDAIPESITSLIKR